MRCVFQKGRNWATWEKKRGYCDIKSRKSDQSKWHIEKKKNWCRSMYEKNWYSNGGSKGVFKREKFVKENNRLMQEKRDLQRDMRNIQKRRHSWRVIWARQRRMLMCWREMWKRIEILFVKRKKNWEKSWIN